MNLRARFIRTILSCCLIGGGYVYAEEKASDQDKPRSTVSEDIAKEASPFPKKSLKRYCFEQFYETEVCPDAVCHLACIEKTKDETCQWGCYAKECLKIASEHCPTDTCEVLMGCSQQEVCYPKDPRGPASCGDLAYAGQDVACCEGLVKKCGVEFFDGTCDMIGQYTEHSVPLCLPCGNGICNQFENRCNCPEDCTPVVPF